MAEYSLADIRSVVDGDNRSGVWGDGAFLWVILIFLFFLAFSGNGLFGNGSSSTAIGLTDLERDVLNGNSNTQRDILTSSCNTQKEVLESRYTTQLGFQNTQAQISSCCLNKIKNLFTKIHDLIVGNHSRDTMQTQTV